MAVGTAAALQAGSFRLSAAVAALLVALAIQIGTNFANDLGDYRRGADTAARVGPTRVTSAGLLSPRQVAAGAWVAYGVAAAAGLYLVVRGGWPVLLAGVASILAGIAYTAGPLPLGYYGLGDVAVFLFFGLVGTVGTYYVQALEVTPLSLMAAVPVGALITAILVVNNLRDMDTDRAAGKRTLAVLLGRRGARIEYVALLIVAYMAPVVLLLAFAQRAWVLLPLLTLPLALGLARAVFAATGPALNDTLAGTARLAALYAAALAVGLVL